MKDFYWGDEALGEETSGSLVSSIIITINITIIISIIITITISIIISDNAHQVNAISDSSYAHPIDTAAKIHAMKSAAPVFVYHFGYRGKRSYAHIKPNTYPPELRRPAYHYGVGSGDDLMYLFPVHWGIFRPFPSEDIMFSTKFTALIASFATKGKPEFKMGEGEEDSAFEWLRADPNNISHLNIGNHIRMDQGLPNHR